MGAGAVVPLTQTGNFTSEDEVVSFCADTGGTARTAVTIRLLTGKAWWRPDMRGCLGSAWERPQFSPALTAGECYPEGSFLPMAQIAPFQPWKYSDKAGKLGDVVTQPYDKISPAMQAGYLAKSPYNLVRIILGERFETDTDTENVYTRAAGYLNDWT